MGGVFRGNWRDLLRSLRRNRHGVGPSLECHWLLDRGRVRLGMGLGDGDEADDRAGLRTRVKKDKYFHVHEGRHWVFSGVVIGRGGRNQAEYTTVPSSSLIYRFPNNHQWIVTLELLTYLRYTPIL